MTVPVGTPRPGNPARSYVGAGPGLMLPKMLHVVANDSDDLQMAFGPRLYAAMLTDPAVGSSYNALRLGAVGTGRVKLTAPESFKAPAWYARGKSAPAPKPKPKPGGTPDAPATPERSLSPEQTRAQEVLEFCERLFGRLGENVLPLLMGLFDAAVFGVKLAEVTYAVPDDGTDAGKLVWGTVAVKANWAWRFVVDHTLAVQGIYTWDAETSQYVFVEPDKFVWHSWMPADNDPRGTSCLRAAYNAWNLKIQAWPAYYQFLVRFGSPGIHGALAEGDSEPRLPLDSAGAEDTTKPEVSASERFRQMLDFYRAGGSVVTPAGAVVTPFEPRSNGEALLAAFDLFDRQICLAIQLQARAAMEAKHGSKADSAVAQDTKGLAVMYGRTSLAGVLRTALRRAVALNFGVADAELYTPNVSLGEDEAQDKAEMLKALSSVGYKIGPSQEEEVDAIAGMPVRDPEQDRQMAEQQATFAADLAAKNAPPPNDTAGGKGSKPRPGGSK